MAKKKNKGKEKFVIPAGVKKRIVVHDDKSKFFNKDMRSTLFFMFWIVGFFALMLWYGMF
jgi:hypothetical protein